MDKEQAKKIADDLVATLLKRFKQELLGETEECNDKTLRIQRDRIARISWKNATKWCKFEQDGPVLMPDFTRIYYRKGKSEIVLQEFAPQTRILSFKGALAKRQNTEESIESNLSSRNFRYSLALPYTIFIFKFIDGKYQSVKCLFSDRPLKNLNEKPLRPFLPNIDSTMNICLGSSFAINDLETNNIPQQVSLILSHFWSSTFSDEWATHFWNYKTHFRNNNDDRFKTLETWQDASIENPLFIVDDVTWLEHTEPSFGLVIAKMLEHDTQNSAFTEDLYQDISEEIVKELNKNFFDSVDSIEEKVLKAVSEQFADKLIELVNPIPF